MNHQREPESSVCQVKPGSADASSNITINLMFDRRLPRVPCGVGSVFSQLFFSCTLCSACVQNPSTEITVTGSSASPCRSVSTQLLHSLSQMLLWLKSSNPSIAILSLQAAELNLTCGITNPTRPQLSSASAHLPLWPKLLFYVTAWEAFLLTTAFFKAQTLVQS